MKKRFPIVRRFSSFRQAKARPGESGSSYKGIAASIIVAIATAAIGYAVSFVDQHLKAEIQKVNTQIEKLYGPLSAYSVASRRAWDDLHGKYRSGKPLYFDDQDMPSAELVEVWRRWMKAVFMPMNLKMESVIIENAQLLDGNRIYPCLVDLISHVESYKATIANWKDTDEMADAKYRTAGANTALIVFPADVHSCIEARLKAALERRNELERSWLGYFTREPNQHFDARCS
jgi:hypothetical protein